MKNTILTFGALLIFGIASAQNDPPTKQDPKTMPVDTNSVIEQTNPEKMKKSETVKTKKHDKSARKSKTVKDTVADKRSNP